MELDLAGGGWKYYAEFVKRYAPNAIGQSLNADPNLTVVEIEDSPILNNIPGVGNASSNQITLAPNLEYLIAAETVVGGGNSGHNEFLILKDPESGEIYDSGLEQLCKM